MLRLFNLPFIVVSEKGRIVIFDLDREQFPGRLPLFRRHTLSEKESDKLEIEGFTTSVTHLEKSGLIILSLDRKNNNFS